ncbi:hypothetical protein C8J56DRAFT_1046422 [Mycena floridula]|nr:hypothetical protein C8J56DRAFT_1046422 [Mycena floridula]
MSPLQHVLCSSGCFLGFRPWANGDQGVKGLLWSTDCYQSHIVTVPRRLGKSWDDSDVNAFNTAAFMDYTMAHVGPRCTDSLALEETPYRERPSRKYLLFARRKVTLVRKKVANNPAEDEDEFEERFEAMGQANFIFHRFLNTVGDGWLGNVLILRLDERFEIPNPVDIDKKDERRLAPLLWRKFEQGELYKWGLVRKCPRFDWGEASPAWASDDGTTWGSHWQGIEEAGWGDRPQRFVEPEKCSVNKLPFELCGLIAKELKWGDMMNLMRTSRRFRDGIQNLIRRRIQEILVLFAGTRPQVHEMIQAMDCSSAVIYGSIVRQVMRKRLFPRDNLNFAVSRYHSKAFRDALSSILGSKPGRAPQEGQRDTVIQRWIWTLSTERTVTLDVGYQQSPLAVVLKAGTTAQMDFITSNHLVCLYPALALEEKSLNATADWETAMKQQELGLTVTDNNSWWSGRCGFSCPEMHRHIKGLKGIGTLNWGDSEQLFWEDDESSWYLGMTCSNADCEQPREESTFDIPYLE